MLRPLLSSLSRKDEFEADEKYDIQAIDVADNSFDMVLCYHVLEHIPDDRKAMSELYRVLKPEGICYIQTPFNDGEIYEDKSIITPEGRLEHFGQDDHLRIYSATGLKSRLEQVGFEVEIMIFGIDKANRNGFKEDEIVLVCKKIIN